MANPTYKYYSDPKPTIGTTGKYWYRIGDDGKYHTYSDKTGTITDPTTLKDTDWTDISTNTTAVTNLKTPTNYTEWTAPTTSLFDIGPSSRATSFAGPEMQKIPGKLTPPTVTSSLLTKGTILPRNAIDLQREQGAINTVMEQAKLDSAQPMPLSQTLFDASMKSIKGQEGYNIAKTVSDSLLTGGALIGNLTAKRPVPIIPKPEVPATYQSVIPEYKNAIDRSAAGTLAAGRMVAQQTGLPELMPAYMADQLGAQNTAYGTLAENDIKQRNLQSEANTVALNKTAENEYTGKVADATMMDAVNLKRSEPEAAMGKSLFSTIPNTYMNNKESLVDMGNKALIYKHLIDSGADAATIAAYKKMYESSGQLAAGVSGLTPTTTAPKYSGTSAEGDDVYSEDGTTWYKQNATTGAWEKVTSTVTPITQ